MCGRVHQNGPDLPGISSEMDASEEELARAYKENRNGAPGEWFWIIRRHPGHGRTVHTPMKWGLLPAWLKDPSGWKYPSNARKETVKANGAFKLPYRRKRCLLPIQLFYEWQKILEEGMPLKKGQRKQPYAIAMKDRQPFGVAGLYDTWTDPATGQPTNTFTVVTCEANSLMATIHDRMPVILAAENYERWIACIEPDPDDLMMPYPSDLMEIWPISSKVNSPSYKAADVADPVDEPTAPVAPAPGQPDLF